MKHILYILLFIASACTAQVHDYNIRIDSPKTTDSTYCLLTATTGSNFAGRGQFKSLAQLAALIDDYLVVTETQGIDDVLGETQALISTRYIELNNNLFNILQGGNEIVSFDGYPTPDITIGGILDGNIKLNLTGTSAYFYEQNGGTDAKLGINKSTPTEALDVTGNGLFSGTLSASNLSGTNTGDAVNIFNDPVTANGVLDYQGFNLDLTNIASVYLYSTADMEFETDGFMTFTSGSSQMYFDNTGNYLSGTLIQLTSSGGNVEIPTLDASTGAEDEWVVRDASTGKLYKKTLTATSLTLGAAATTFALTANVMTITGNGGGNTLVTITGGISGQILTLIFADANVTITDDAGGTANTVNLSAAFTSTANDILTLVHNGTSWREVSRSVN